MVSTDRIYIDCRNVDDYIENTLNEDSRNKIKCGIG